MVKMVFKKRLHGYKQQIIYKSSSGPSKGRTCEWVAARVFHTSTCRNWNGDAAKPHATWHSRVLLLPCHGVI